MRDQFLVVFYLLVEIEKIDHNYRYRAKVFCKNFLIVIQEQDSQFLFEFCFLLHEKNPHTHRHIEARTHTKKETKKRDHTLVNRLTITQKTFLLI